MPTAIITSDLHLGFDTVASIQFQKHKIVQHDPAVVIIAGDIGESVKNFRECLRLFSDVKCPVGVIIGNHDLYAYDKRYPSEELWTKVLPRIAKKLGFVWMEEENIVVNGTAFIGTVGWYDYSSNTLKVSDRFYEEEKGAFISDGSYIDWLRTDKDFAAALLAGLVKRLEKAQNDPAVRRIIVVTHVPLFKEQMVRHGSDNLYADAYFGNFTMGKEVLRFSKVTDVISGHTHRKVDKVVRNIRVQVVPSDYFKPAFITLEL